MFHYSNRMTKLPKLMAVLLAVYVVGIFGVYHVGTVGFYNVSESAPKGFYQIVASRVASSNELTRGDYVVLPMPEKVLKDVRGRSWVNEDSLLLKRVGAVSGDVVVITDDACYINGDYQGPVFIQDGNGLALPKIRGTFKIKDGEFLPISSYERSFDGRYFGPVPVAVIEHKVVPFITF